MILQKNSKGYLLFCEKEYYFKETGPMFNI